MRVSLRGRTGSPPAAAVSSGSVELDEKVV